VKLDEVILTTVSIVLCARFRFVAIQVARGPLERIEVHSIHATRGAKVAHGMQVVREMTEDAERITAACGRARVVSAVERGEAVP